MMGTAHICLSRVFTWEKAKDTKQNNTISHKCSSEKLFNAINWFDQFGNPSESTESKVTELNIDFDNFNRFSL